MNPVDDALSLAQCVVYERGRTTPLVFWPKFFVLSVLLASSVLHENYRPQGLTQSRRGVRALQLQLDSGSDWGVSAGSRDHFPFPGVAMGWSFFGRLGSSAGFLSLHRHRVVLDTHPEATPGTDEARRG